MFLASLRLRRWWPILLAPAAYILTRLASAFPDVVESVYSTGAYPVLAGFFGRVFGLFPFSVAEFIIYALIILVPLFLFFRIRRIVRNPGNRAQGVLRLVLTVLAALSCVYFLFTVFCGLNYHRLSFARYSGLVVRDSSSQELAALCEELIHEANGLRSEVAEDEGGVMELSFSSMYEAASHAGATYGNLSRDYPVLQGYTPRTKPVLFSRGMSYLDITGVYFPITFEANVNTDVPDYSIPAAMMHELSHYRGFMREDEANFISFLACRASGNADFAYSGTMLALTHTSNALYSADRDLYYEVIGGLSEKIRADIECNREYWKQFEGPVSEVSTAVNNTYLRANSQEDGVRSYGRMVDLLLADYRNRHGFA